MSITSFRLYETHRAAGSFSGILCVCVWRLGGAITWVVSHVVQIQCAPGGEGPACFSLHGISSA